MSEDLVVAAGIAALHERLDGRPGRAAYKSGCDSRSPNCSPPPAACASLRP